MAEEREVVARLKVERTGEEGAFSETAGEIRELDSAAGESTGGLDQLAESEKSAADAAGDLKTEVAGAGQAASSAAEPVAALGDAAEGTGQKALTSREKLEDMFLKVGASLPVLHEAERALEGLSETLNDIAEAAGGTGHEFDGLGSKFGAFTASVTQFLSKVGNIDDAFAAFSNTNGTLIQRLDAAKEALDGLSPSAQKFKDSITGTDEKLQAEADAMRRVVSQMETAGDVHEKEGERIGKALADMAKKADKAGVDLGDAFEEMARKYPEVTNAADEHAKALEKEGDAAANSADQQTEALGSVGEAAADLTEKHKELGEANAAAGEKAEESKGFWDGLIETFTGVQDSAADTGEAIKDAADGAGDGAQGLADAGEAGAAAGEGLAAAKEGAAGLGEAAENSKTGVANLATELGNLPNASSGIQSSLESLNGVSFEGILAAIREVRSELQGAAADAAALKTAVADADSGGEAA